MVSMRTEASLRLPLGGSCRRRRLMRDCTKQNIPPCCAVCLHALIRRGKLGTFPKGEGLDAGDRWSPLRGVRLLAPLCKGSCRRQATEGLFSTL